MDEPSAIVSKIKTPLKQTVESLIDTAKAEKSEKSDDGFEDYKEAESPALNIETGTFDLFAGDSHY